MAIERLASMFPGMASVREIEGEALQVAGREIRPVVRVTSAGRGGKWILATIRPVALIETADGQSRRLKIGARKSGSFLALALLAPVLIWLVASSLRRRRR